MAVDDDRVTASRGVWGKDGVDYMGITTLGGGGGGQEEVCVSESQ